MRMQHSLSLIKREEKFCMKVAIEDQVRKHVRDNTEHILCVYLFAFSLTKLCLKKS